MKAYTIIVAGGRGNRMGADRPKQLLKLAGLTILERTIRPFLACPDINGVVIVTEKSIISEVNSITAPLHSEEKPVTVVEGGKERQDSVMNGLSALPEDTDVVLVHDAVRPFILPGLISTCVEQAAKHGAVCVMRPSPETVKLVDDGIVTDTPDRSRVWIAQTPQAFRKGILLEAHQKALHDNVIGTDDCMLVERAGHQVHVVQGTDYNIKITTPADLATAGTMLSFIEQLEGS